MVKDLVQSLWNMLKYLINGEGEMLLLLGCGIFLSIGLGFLQLRKFSLWCKVTLGSMLRTERGGKGPSPFEAMCTALAASVGTGNIAGVCAALTVGGPGAIFWMWISAFFGMATKYAEILLALRYRERGKNGEWVGGPMYYIKNGLGEKWSALSGAFCVFGALAAFGIGNITQINTAASALVKATGEEKSALVIGALMAIGTATVLLGGAGRVGKMCAFLIPFAAVFYLAACLGVLLLRRERIPAAFGMMLRGAFSPAAATGGLLGISFRQCLLLGLSRGVFSNEAGLGSAPIAYAGAETTDAVRQGMFGFFEVFADTVVMCTLTALMLLCSLETGEIPYGREVGAELAVQGLSTVYPEKLAACFVAGALLLFAFSTALSWGLYGCRCAEFLLGPKVRKSYTAVFCLAMLPGATMQMEAAWALADTLNALMALPNLVAVFLLSPKVFCMSRYYFSLPKKRWRGTFIH